MRTRVFVLVAVAFGVAAIAFICGVRVGAVQSELLQSTVRASLLVGELRALRGDKQAELVRTKDIELDGQVLRYAQFLRSGLPLLFWPDSANFEHERYLRSVAEYRKVYPPVMPKVIAQSPSTATPEMREGAMLVETTTSEIIGRYAQ